MQVTTCGCGYRHDSLQQDIVEHERVLAECLESTHPMRNAVIAAERRALAVLRGHLAETTKQFDTATGEFVPKLHSAHDDANNRLWRQQ